MYQTIAKSTVAAGIGVLLLSLAGFGCGQESPQPAAAPEAEAPAAPSAEPAAIPRTPPPAPAGTVLSSTEGETPGVRVEVREFKRASGGTVTLKFSMINDSENKVEFGYAFVDPDHQTKDYNSIGGIHLIDAAAKKKYFVVRDSDNRCLCSSGLKPVAPGSRMNLWAKFPAPADDVDRITIVIPHFVPMDDVPISR